MYFNISNVICHTYTYLFCRWYSLELTFCPSSNISNLICAIPSGAAESARRTSISYMGRNSHRQIKSGDTSRTSFWFAKKLQMRWKSISSFAYLNGKGSAMTSIRSLNVFVCSRCFTGRWCSSCTRSSATFCMQTETVAFSLHFADDTLYSLSMPEEKARHNCNTSQKFFLVRCTLGISSSDLTPEHLSMLQLILIVYRPCTKLSTEINVICKC